MELLCKSTNFCAGCGVSLALRMISKACPEKVIVSMATSCAEVCTTIYPNTSWNVPWLHAAFETAASVASGIESAVKKIGKNWKVLAIAGDGGTFDIGFQALSGMFERGHKVTFICVDNESYSNTGVQRSGATPYGAWTTTSPPGKENLIGNTTFKKPITEILAAHGIPYSATASVAYPGDLIEKTKKAFENQPSFLHILSPCPVGWKFGTEKTIELARLAVETGMWVLFEINNKQLRITKKIENRKPVREYLERQRRFKHILENKEEIKKIEKHIDSEWARLEKIEKAGIVL